MLKRELARLKEGNEILRKSGGVLRAGAAVRYAWIAGQKDHSVRLLCRVLRAPNQALFWDRPCFGSRYLLHSVSIRCSSGAPTLTLFQFSIPGNVNLRASTTSLKFLSNSELRNSRLSEHLKHICISS